MANQRPIRDLIAKYESEGAVKAQGALSAYDVVWGGISRKDYPPAPLSTLTVAEVLDWQDGIDSRYNSEAAGRYQIMEDTLRGLVDAGAVSRGDVFNAVTQDKLADALMERRGWSDFVAGRISLEQFGDNLAKEWASFPVFTRQRGGSRTVEPGQSYYAGDGLNKAHVSVAEIRSALEAALGPKSAPQKPEQPSGDVEARLAALLARLNAQEARIASLEQTREKIRNA